MKKGKTKKAVRREKIDEATLLRWKIALRHGDIAKMSEELKIPHATISYAVQGYATPNVRNKVEKWVNKNYPISEPAAA
jgi:hypothetical protein